jgi:hypothetical protein
VKPRTKHAFSYSEEEWQNVAVHLTQKKKTISEEALKSARKRLEVTGNRYLRLKLHDDGPKDVDSQWRYEKRRKIAKQARELLAELEHIGGNAPVAGRRTPPLIRAADIGLGRHAADFDLDFTEVLAANNDHRSNEEVKAGIVDRTAISDLAELRGKLGIIAAWIEADNLKFFPRKSKSNAERPAKAGLVASALAIWESVTDSKIPRGGGNDDSLQSRYLCSACNPILPLGEDKKINDGAAARNLIAACMRNRTE